jgi:hypothetical protein
MHQGVAHWLSCMSELVQARRGASHEMMCNVLRFSLHRIAPAWMEHMVTISMENPWETDYGDEFVKKLEG